jgi:hypothetical protein
MMKVVVVVNLDVFTEEAGLRLETAELEMNKGNGSNERVSNNVKSMLLVLDEQTAREAATRYT